MKYEVNFLGFEEFQNYAKDFKCVYNSPVFLNTIDKDPACIQYLTVGNKKPKAVLYIAEIDKQLRMPFSAPFWNIEKLKKTFSIQSITAIVEALNSYLTTLEKKVSITLPPAFYDEKFINIIINSFHNSGFRIKCFDINYHFDLNKINTDTYIDSLDPNARRNLRIANGKGLICEISNCKEDFSVAYEIIRQNRAYKNYPLKLSEDQLYKTLNTVGGDVFTIKEKDEKIASAFLFNVNKEVKHLIYWGDKPGRGDSKAINFLSHQLILHYANTKYKKIDLGPSSDEGVINLGLANFKESVGAFSSLKTTLIKNYN